MAGQPTGRCLRALSHNAGPMLRVPREAILERAVVNLVRHVETVTVGARVGGALVRDGFAMFVVGTGRRDGSDFILRRWRRRRNNWSRRRRGGNDRWRRSHGGCRRARDHGRGMLEGDRRTGARIFTRDPSVFRITATKKQGDGNKDDCSHARTLSREPPRRFVRPFERCGFEL